MLLDGDLRDFIGNTGFADSNDPSRAVPALDARVGYNFTYHLGFSLGAAGGTASGVAYLTPFAAGTYTLDLNARTSPFVTAGTQFTRISGNGRKDHPTWGAHAGSGLRHMVSEILALRLEGRMALEHDEGVPDRRLVARGYGQTQPIFPEGREGNAWQNRRVELKRIP